MLARIGLILILMLNCFLLYQFLWGKHSLNQYLELRDRKRELKTNVQKMQKENLELSRQIRNMNNNSQYLKKVIRGRMNMLHSNEVVYLLTNSSRCSK